MPEKVSKFDAKSLQNDAKMDTKMEDFQYFFEKGENAPDSLFFIVKRGSGHAKSDVKSTKKRCKIDAGSSDAKRRYNYAKTEPKRMPKSIKDTKMPEKCMPKFTSKFECETGFPHIPLFAP